MELLAIALELAPPPTGVRAAATEVMTEIVRERELPRAADARRIALDDLLRPLVDAAGAARREADEEYRQAMTALHRLQEARRAESDQRVLRLLAAGTRRLVSRAAELLIVAHVRGEEAKGAARAVSLAYRGVLPALPETRPPSRPAVWPGAGR